MHQGTRLDQNLQTVQRLSPRQVQFVRLLEMSAPEIEEEVQRQLDDNPALERVEASDDAQSADFDASLPESADPDDDPADYYSYRGGNDQAYTPQIAADSPDLYASLMSQLGQTEMTEANRAIASYIIGNIDENGYLTRTLTSMADDLSIATGADITYQMMQEPFSIVRALDPPGVGAVDLRDCLLLQINRKPSGDDDWRLAREIVADNFDLLSKKHFERLQSRLGIRDTQTLRGALQLIQQLNPKPGSSIAVSDRQLKEGQISPDVTVEETDDGRMTVALATRLPHLQIERSFSKDDIPATNRRQREAQAFVRLKRDDAEAFISAIKQRGTTLLTIAQAIVKRQMPFFLTGDKSQLKPMVLKDVAQDTGYDISVVSRGTMDKYMSTDHGVFPLKMFFSEAPTDDTETSNHQLMSVMSSIIETEDPKHPLSDQAIQSAMAKHGFDLARRTVSKYREKLGIPVARLRKKL